MNVSSKNIIIFILLIFHNYAIAAVPDGKKNTEYSYPQSLDDYRLKEGYKLFSEEETQKITDDTKLTANELYTLGYMYQYGENIESDLKKAEKYYSKSEKAGNIDAKIALGRMYRDGTGGVIPKAINRALALFSEAAQSKNKYALYEMGKAYEYGMALFPDRKKALSLYDEAAKNGFLLAHAKLGVFHLYGVVGEPDINMARNHFQFLFDNTVNEDEKKYAKVMLGAIYAKIAKDKTEEDEKLKYLKLAAEYGDVASQSFLGGLYITGGMGQKKNYAESFKWFSAAAEAGDMKAMEGLGYIYSTGSGAEKSPEKAFEWYVKAAGKGSAEAAWNVGVAYKYGNGVPKNDAEADKWFNLSREITKKQ